MNRPDTTPVRVCVHALVGLLAITLAATGWPATDVGASPAGADRPVVNAAAPSAAPAAPGAPGAHPTPAGLDGEARDAAGDIAAIHPRLGAVEISGEAYPRELAELSDLNVRIQEAQTALTEAEAELVRLQADESDLAGILDRSATRLAKADAWTVEVREERVDLAVQAYIDGNDADIEAIALDPDVVNQYQADQALVEGVSEDQADRHHHLEATRDASEEEVAVRSEELAETRLDLFQTRNFVELTRAQVETLSVQRDAQQWVVEETRATSTVTGTDFSLVALDAYTRAAESLAVSEPSCGIRWQAIAGITRVESRHGTYRGARVAADGTITPHIIGPALDGEGDFALILDTDGGSLDGDSTYDRAVGPTQFIPSTWRRWAKDQTGDGRADPHNLYDAALSTGHYLCSAGPGLDGDAGMRRAFFRYNHSNEYVETVLGHVHRYDDFEIPPVA